jgi:hypothetical protein
MLLPLLLLLVLAAAGISWLQGCIQLYTCYWLLHCISQHHCLAVQCLLLLWLAWHGVACQRLQGDCPCCNKCRLLLL